METFITSGVIGLSLGAQYALIAIGFTLIFGILGVVNFAHGGFYVLGGYIAFTLSHSLGVPFVVAVVLATLATAAIGYVVEIVLVERYVVDHLATMLITLGFYQILITGIIVIYGAEPVEFRFPLSGSFRYGGFYVPYSNLVVFAVCGFAIAAIYWLVYKTRYGIALRAMADDRPCSARAGHPAGADVPDGVWHRDGARRPHRRAGDADAGARSASSAKAFCSKPSSSSSSAAWAAFRAPCWPLSSSA